MPDLSPPAHGWVGQWLASMLREARDYGVMLLDPQGRVIAWLPGAEHLFGYTQDEAVGRHFGFIFAEEDQAAKLPEHELAVASAVGRAQDDRWHIRKDGSRLWATGATIAIRSTQGDLLGFGKMLRDRTDLRTQIESLKNTVRELAQARDAREAFLGVLAHELRNPLAPLKAAASLMKRLAPDPEPLERPLQIIDRQLQALQRLLDDLMDMARSNTGKLRFEPQRACLQEELAEALASVHAQALAKGLQLEGVLPEVPILIDLDHDRFQQIVVNLLNNAIKHTPPGGAVWLKASTDSGHAVVKVEDNGSGIPPELQPTIFDLFTQGPGAAPERRGSGLGIGLALVKELVTLHRGTVAVRSEGPGKGAEFTVRMPLRHTFPGGPLG